MDFFWAMGCARGMAKDIYVLIDLGMMSGLNTPNEQTRVTMKILKMPFKIILKRNFEFKFLKKNGLFKAATM